MTTTIKAKPQKKETPKENTLIESERQTIVHIEILAGGNMRIWPSTYLIENETGNRLKLLKSFNISNYPQWQYIQGAFLFENIKRNESDVYRISL